MTTITTNKELIQHQICVPKEAHIPRPAKTSTEFIVSDPAANNKWKEDFNKAMGNMTLSGSVKNNLISSLLIAKEKIEAALSVFEVEIKEQDRTSGVQSDRILFDIPYPVPDSAAEKSEEKPNDKETPDNNSEETNKKPLKMNEWSREKMDLYSTIDANVAEISQQYIIIDALKQERDEQKKLIHFQEEKLSQKRDKMKIYKNERIILRERVPSLLKNPDSVKTVSNDDYVYKGTVSADNIPHGFGQFIKTKDNIKILSFIGHVKNGKEHGYGILSEKKTENPSVYSGHWLNGKYEGHGILKTRQGKYIGNFRNNLREGKGILRETNGEVYNGEWKNNFRCGFGKAVLEEKSVYEGSWKNDYFHGEGTLTQKDGFIYKGEWKNGLKHGTGEWSGPDGERYDGKWSEGVKEGKGKYTHTEGWIYDGQWENNKKQGEGKLFYQNSSYEGLWEDDCRQGQGRYIFNNGETYKGNWKSNMAHGQGTFAFNDGAKYEGNFERGWPKGLGVFTFPDGQKIKRQWLEHLPSGYRIQTPWQKTMFR